MNSNTGCLVIHGFGGSIREVESLVTRLQEEGYQVLAPSLKGHTGLRRDMRSVTYRDWIASAEDDVRHLFTVCDKVHLIGFSMGGLIAVNLGLQYKTSSIITINTPIYYWNIKRIIFNLIDDFRKREIKHTRRYLRASNVPFSALVNFKLLLYGTKAKLKEVTCPVLVIQSTEDDTVRKRSAEYIFMHIGSEKKQLCFFDSTRHVILRGPEAEDVIQRVLEFLRQVR